MTILATLGRRNLVFGTLALIAGTLFARGGFAPSSKGDSAKREASFRYASVFDFNQSGVQDVAGSSLTTRATLIPMGAKAQSKGKRVASSGSALLQVKVVNLIPASLSGETNQDSEPFLAIQPANPQIMVASAFTPNPISTKGNAPVYVSQNGGNTWVLNAIAPVQRMTCDMTHAISAAENHPRGDLHAGTLACASAITLEESETIDVSSSTSMSMQSIRTNVDQPFVRALAISNNDHIYVGVNDFNQPRGHTATVDVSHAKPGSNVQLNVVAKSTIADLSVQNPQPIFVTIDQYVQNKDLQVQVGAHAAAPWAASWAA